MRSTQKNGTFAVVEARNAPCPMEWGCPKDRSMTVERKKLIKNQTGAPIVRKKGPSCEFQNTVPERTFPPQKPFTLKGIGNDGKTSCSTPARRTGDHIHTLTAS